MTFVPVCDSPRSKLSSVGMLVIMYVSPKPLCIMSGQSYSISQKETPPSSSPTPSSISPWSTGETAEQVLQ